MVDRRASHTQDIISIIENAYGGKIRIFNEYIPRSVRVAEATARGISIFSHEPNGKVASAYRSLVTEVISDAS